MGKGGNLVIPSTIGGIPVTIIGATAFRGQTTITGVVLPESVTTLTGASFEECSNLTTVEMPGVTNIEDWSFGNCSKLKTVIMPVATNIGVAAFLGCSSLTSVEMPSVITVGGAAFSGCTNLSTVKMPEVTSISDSFWGCSSLAVVDMPKVVTIGNTAFFNCTALNNVKIPKVTTIGQEAFENCISLTTIELPNITELKYETFNGCTSLQSVLIPKRTDFIAENNVFNSCTSLRKVTLYYGADPINNTSIPDWEYYVNWKMSSGTFDAGDYITEGWVSNDSESRQIFGLGYTFDETTQTIIKYVGTDENIVIPSEINGIAVKVIGDDVFNGKLSLKTIQIPDSVTSIGTRAFINCKNLTSVVMPKVTSIGDYAFGDCSSLTAVEMPMLTTLGDSAFRNCTNLVNVQMPEVTSIGYSAFRGCENFVSVEMPKLTSLGSYAFKYCTNLSSAKIQLLTSIKDNTFENCVNLKSIELWKDVTIGKDVFLGATSLSKAIIYYGNEPIDKVIIDNWKDMVTSKLGESMIGQITERWVSNNSGYRNLDEVIVDTTPPVITLNGDSKVTVEVGESYTEQGATVEDNTGEKIEVVIGGNIDTKKVGEYTITYNAADSSGNNAIEVTRTVKVIDTKAPVITLNGDEKVNVEFGSKYIEKGATANDVADGQIDVKVEGSVNTYKLGSYKITYTAIDSYGNTTTAIRTVNVVDTKAPTIKLIGPEVVKVIKGTKYIELGAVAVDNLNLFTKVSITGVVNTKQVGEYKVVYTSTDSSGNTSKRTRTVKVVNWYYSF